MDRKPKNIDASADARAAKSKTKSGRKPTRTKSPSKRREQQRAIEKRRAILDAALEEFAERGFEGASIRRIGERASVDWTLITYHFRNKSALWRAVATDAFDQITATWEKALGAGQETTAADRVKIESKIFLQFTVQHTAFHHFMLQENHGSSPRLKWLIQHILLGLKERMVVNIRQAQAHGQMLPGDPDLVYYMLIGMLSVLSSLKDEMKTTIGVSHNDTKAVEAYWRLVERAMFRSEERRVGKECRLRADDTLSLHDALPIWRARSARWR